MPNAPLRPEPPPRPTGRPAATGAGTRPWRVLLAVLIGTVCWFAFTPNPPPEVDTGWDKLNHWLAFSALAGCAWFGWAGSPRRWLGVPLALMAFGGFIELVQRQIPGRSAEWPDLLADALGIAAGLAVGMALERARAAAVRRRRALRERRLGRLTP